MRALILFGGLGTRLRPLTYTVPKPMLPVVNKPFAAYQLELLKRHRIRDITFCLSYLPGLFKDYFGDGKRWGLRIDYAIEKDPLGTAGAIKNALRGVNNREPFIVFNGDILTDLDLTRLINFHRSKKSFATIALTPVQDPSLYGLVEMSETGRIERFIEKPNMKEVSSNIINAGTYIFNPGVLQYIPDGIPYSAERELFPSLLAERIPVYGFVNNTYWLDIGTADKYLQAHFDILSNVKKWKVPGKKIKRDVWAGPKCIVSSGISINGRLSLGKKVQIEESVEVNGIVSIGDNCLIGKEVSLSNCVMLNNVKIKDKARIEKSLLGNNCVVGENAHIGKGNCLGDGTVIERNSKL